MCNPCCPGTQRRSAEPNEILSAGSELCFRRLRVLYCQHAARFYAYEPVSYFEKLYRNDELPHRAKLVYIYLYDRRDAVGKAWPSVKRIAKDLSISEKTVRRAIQDLEKAGLIRKEYAYRKNGSHTSNRYYLL